MEESPRFRFFSLTFVVGFGVGAFVGVAMGLVAFGLVGSADDTTTAAALTPTAVVTPAPGATSTPVRARTNTAIDVRIGPGSEFAGIGTIARGESLDVVGRDDKGEWIAVRFPPGSNARGWLPTRVIDNLETVTSLAVVAPTQLPRTVSTPSFTGSGSSGSTPGTNVTPGSNDGTVEGTPSPGTTPGTTGTPKPPSPPDLTASRVSRLNDGRIQVVVTNRGGDLVGFQVFVIVADPTTRSEQLRSPGAGLKGGESVTLESDNFTVTEPTSVIVTIDPSFSINDSNRANNSSTTMLAPPTTPTVVPTPAATD